MMAEVGKHLLLAMQIHADKQENKLVLAWLEY
jgi:hypothetical protein